MVSSQLEKSRSSTRPFDLELNNLTGSSTEAFSLYVQGAFKNHVHPENLILKVPMGGGLCEPD